MVVLPAPLPVLLFHLQSLVALSPPTPLCARSGTGCPPCCGCRSLALALVFGSRRGRRERREGRRNREGQGVQQRVDRARPGRPRRRPDLSDENPVRCSRSRRVRRRRRRLPLLLLLGHLCEDLRDLLVVFAGRRASQRGCAGGQRGCRRRDGDRGRAAGGGRADPGAGHGRVQTSRRSSPSPAGTVTARCAARRGERGEGNT